LAIAACLAGVPARAQSPPPGSPPPGSPPPGSSPSGDSAPEGLTRKEILANERVRVLGVALEPEATIPQHTHAQLHITAALGSAELTDIAADGSERRITVPDGGLNMEVAGTTHSLRNEGDTPFRAVAIDLLTPQTGVRNRCGMLLK